MDVSRIQLIGAKLTNVEDALKKIYGPCVNDKARAVQAGQYPAHPSTWPLHLYCYNECLIILVVAASDEHELQHNSQKSWMWTWIGNELMLVKLGKLGLLQ